ncbi:MAG: oligoendopeptidase F [Sphaerochaetaceae bacterium]
MSADKNTYSIPERKDVPESDTWDLGSLYSSPQNWEVDCKRLQTAIGEAASFQGSLGDSPDALLAALGWLSEKNQLLERMYSYAHLRHSTDGGDPSNQRGLGMATQLYAAFAAATSFFDPEIQAIDSQTLEQWMALPVFKDYRIMLGKLLRFKPHVLTQNEERIMAMQSEVGGIPHEAFGALTNVDFDFGTIATAEGELPLSQSTFSMFLQNKDRSLREAAYRQFYAVYDHHRNVLTNLYAGSVKQDIFRAKVRKYPDARHMFLFPDNVETSVYDNLVDSVHGALPLLHRYYTLRRKMLKLDRLAHYDVYVPLVEGISVHHTYDQAVDIVCKALAPLGQAYVDTIRAGLTTEHWVDRYENKGKRSGAFSSGSYQGKPYILLNYKEDVLRDVFTLAHEGGHSMHSYYSVRNNPFPSYDYTIFEAEVASTFNEQLVADYLFKHAESQEMAAYVVGKQLDDIVATLFRQTMFAEYEALVHQQVEQDEPITVDSLRAVYRRLLETYFGPEVEFLPESDLEGLRIPHFYNAFYVYKYATGICASMALADKVLHGSPSDREQYLAFLKSGGSTYPIDSLRKAGVDMGSVEPIRQAMRQFGILLDRFEQLAL